MSSQHRLAPLRHKIEELGKLNKAMRLGYNPNATVPNNLRYKLLETNLGRNKALQNIKIAAALKLAKRIRENSRASRQKPETFIQRAMQKYMNIRNNKRNNTRIQLKILQPNKQHVNIKVDPVTEEVFRKYLLKSPNKRTALLNTLREYLNNGKTITNNNRKLFNNSESQKEMLKMIQNHSEKTAQAYSSYIKKSKQSNNFGPGHEKPNFPTLNGRTPHGRLSPLSSRKPL